MSVPDNIMFVTGAAGFIGSHLCEELLRRGEAVVGIDALTASYDASLKRRNLARLAGQKHFQFIEGDLLRADLAPILARTAVVYHLAGQPGVRLSWGSQFEEYIVNNIKATQHLLEQVRAYPLRKFVYASSSSIYGNSNREVLAETDVPHPFSPYGVTKLAAEHLVFSYRENHGVPGVALRFFTVFGPRQRPDMAFQRIVLSVIAGSEFAVYGDGTQVRDFTFVGDIVDGCIAAGARGADGGLYNLGGTNHASLNEVIGLIGDVAGKKVKVKYIDRQKGDVLKTHADIRRAQKDLGYAPKISLREGLKQQYEYELGIRTTTDEHR